MSKRFVHRKSSATSAPPKPKDTYFWAPGVHVTVHAPLDLQVVHDLLSSLQWTVCAAVEEQTKKESCHSHILIWAPQTPLPVQEYKWSAKELSVRLGKWPNIQPVPTEAQAINVTAYLCKQALPALYTCDAYTMRRWTRAVYDKTCDLHQKSVIDSPHLCESYNSQVRRIYDGWNLSEEE